jgi:hypothetical protein
MANGQEAAGRALAVYKNISTDFLLGKSNLIPDDIEK